MASRRTFSYSGEQLTHLAFPLGGLGAGMICLEGNGGINHVSLRSNPQLYYEPGIFASVAASPSRAPAGAATARSAGDEKNADEKNAGSKATGSKNAGSKNESVRVRIAEGPLQAWKAFGPSDDRGNGIRGRSYGFPRFREANFEAQFPFGTVHLADPTFPVAVRCTGWSPFVPGDADASSLPTAILEYTLTNTTREAQDVVFGFHVPNFAGAVPGKQASSAPSSVHQIDRGFVFQSDEGGISAASVTDAAGQLSVDCSWFRGAWFDASSILWKKIRTGSVSGNPPPEPDTPPSPGASLWERRSIAPAASAKVVVIFCWHFPRPALSAGERTGDPACGSADCNCSTDTTHRPWYSEKFADVEAVTGYVRSRYADLRQRTERFAECFASMQVPADIAEAVSANLSILKSPTVLRDPDGRLWGWEGCFDNAGCCYGSCTHVWNYAQAVPHLFPELERGMRETELHCSQDPSGHQNFRTALPITFSGTRQIAAADGQLGGIIKVYREWRVCGLADWIARLWPYVKGSLDFAIRHWDPEKNGTLREAHHNTYDIEFWGPEGMCTSIYLAALLAAAEMGEALGKDVAEYRELHEKGREYLETRLFNGEYFVQELEYRKLSRPYDPTAESSQEGREIAAEEGPKYQYVNGCLSDGIIGAWMAEAAGLPRFLDSRKVESHLLSIFRYNFAPSRLEHGNPQRAGYALNDEGGLLLCTWPNGGEPSLPFVYSHEVWTGIEYQVASHLIMTGHFDEGLRIVRACRARYTGVRRNPFDEYECGHWYARALASYSLLQAVSGVRFDAVTGTLFIDPRTKGDTMTFLSTASGYGLAGLRGGKPTLEIWSGTIEARNLELRGKSRSIFELVVKKA